MGKMKRNPCLSPSPDGTAVLGFREDRIRTATRSGDLGDVRQTAGAEETNCDEARVLREAGDAALRAGMARVSLTGLNPVDFPVLFSLSGVCVHCWDSNQGRG